MRTFKQKQKAIQERSSLTFGMPNAALSEQSRERLPGLQAQQMIGHHAVQHLRLSPAQAPEANAAGNISTGFAHDFSQIPLLPNGRSNVPPQRQLDAPRDTLNSTSVIEATAQNGLRGHGGPLPFLNTIQQSFGSHDVTGVKAFIDEAARDANEQLGAAAYTTGRSVAFKQPPNLHTAAHEAAHLVQQQAGVQLPGGVGQAGDPYEQQADTVADAVVAGRSAQPLLDRYTGVVASSSDQVQFQSASGERYEPLQPGQPRPSGGREGAGMNNRGSCQLRSGTLQWSLEPRIGSVNARIEFIPSAGVMAAHRTISFIQTVSTQDTTEGLLGTGLGSDTWISPTEVDALPQDRDPFYGAQWNRATERWGDEPNSTQARPGDYEGRGGTREGSRPATASSGSAVLNDSPMLALRQVKEFETAVVVAETGEVLGSLSWTIQRWPAGFLGGGSSTIVRRAECREGASSTFQPTVDRFYSSRDRTIILSGFSVGSADLPANHPQELSPIVERLRADPNRRAIVGGAATQDEANPGVLSRQRAERVRAYLVSQGIVESRIEIEAYGSDWARVPVTRPEAASANRRVQIRVT